MEHCGSMLVGRLITKNPIKLSIALPTCLSQEHAHCIHVPTYVCVEHLKTRSCKLPQIGMQSGSFYNWHFTLLLQFERRLEHFNTFLSQVPDILWLSFVDVVHKCLLIQYKLLVFRFKWRITSNNVWCPL